jgi:hypothetical protein
MLILKAMYCHLLSMLKCCAADYDKALHYARKAATSYMRSKRVFSSKRLERHIERIAERVIPSALVKDLPPRDGQRVGILASTIFDVGGHTECLMRFVESFHADYDLHLFLTNTNGSSCVQAKTKYAQLQSVLRVTSLEGDVGGYRDKIISLLEAVLDARVKMLFVYMHMDDVVSCAVLCYLARHTDVKVVFFNHGDHTFSLGFEGSHLVIELRRQGQYITEKYRNKRNTTLIPLQGVRGEKLRIYTDEELRSKRRSLGLTADDLVTLSGFSSYKVFKDKKNSYLTLIKNLLLNEERCKHILVTEISEKERKSIDKVFRGNEHLLERLIVIERVVEFDLLLQVADLYIDSFPLGSALVHIDAIRNRRPTMIKKNSRNESYTFYNYLYEGYEYAVEDVGEMLARSLFLLRDREERERVAKRCYQHYLETYEFETIKARYKLLIDNHQELSRFHTPLPADYSCKISSGA